MGSKIKSDFLFASPSGMSGAGRLLDWGNTFDSYNSGTSAEEADTRAAEADWNAVGDYLYDAMMSFEQTHGSAK